MEVIIKMYNDFDMFNKLNNDKQQLFYKENMEAEDHIVFGKEVFSIASFYNYLVCTIILLS